jgi:hypothetical protein
MLLLVSQDDTLKVSLQKLRHTAFRIFYLYNFKNVTWCIVETLSYMELNINIQSKWTELRNCVMAGVFVTNPCSFKYNTIIAVTGTHVDME